MMNDEIVANKIEIITKEDEPNEVCDICNEPNYPLFSWCSSSDYLAYMCPLCVTSLYHGIPGGIIRNLIFKDIMKEEKNE